MPIKYIFIFFFLFAVMARSSLAIEGAVVVSTDPSFLDKWTYTLGSNAPQISKSKTVFVNQKFSVLLFISNYALGSARHVEVDYDMEILGPDRERIFFQKGIKGLRTQVVQHDQVLLSESSLNVSLDSTEKLGAYEVIVRLHDLFNGSSRVLKDTLVLTEYVYRPFFKSDEVLSAWKDNYYQNPQPELAIDGLLYFAQSEALTDQATYWANFMFFLEVFKQNPYLFPTLLELYPDQSPATRTQILCLLRFSPFNTSVFAASLPDAERKTLLQLRQQNLADPMGEIASPQQLEMLWQVFLASGKFSTIHKLVALLDNARHIEYHAYRSAEDPDAAGMEKDLEAALGEGIYQVATLTLVTQCESHPLVREYCEFLYERVELTEVARKELGEILGK